MMNGQPLHQERESSLNSTSLRSSFPTNDNFESHGLHRRRIEVIMRLLRCIFQPLPVRSFLRGGRRGVDGTIQMAGGNSTDRSADLTATAAQW